MPHANFYGHELDEIFAKNALETLFPLFFDNIVCGDKPDLRQGDLFGIEVTKAACSKEQEFTGNWNQQVGRLASEVTAIILKANPSYDSEGRLCSVNPPSELISGTVDFQKVFEKKIQCLNDNYDTHFKYNCLFVYNLDYNHEKTIYEIFKIFDVIQHTASLSGQKTFDILFIWDSFKIHVYYSQRLSSALIDEIFQKSANKRWEMISQNTKPKK